jgi:hypothetical protein
MQCSLFLSLHFVVYGHAVGADGLADIAHGDMAGIDLVGVQVIHRLKLGDEHGVVPMLRATSLFLSCGITPSSAASFVRNSLAFSSVPSRNFHITI